MTNHLMHLFGVSATARLRGQRGGGRGISLIVSLGLLVCAMPALAAEVVEVRVGRHSTFTRVVFELDQPAGYRIERSDPNMDVAELVVSLEASSTARTIHSKSTLIEQVDVEPNGSRSVVRVRLAREGLRLKEMILTNPPRIVLDLINDDVSVAAKTPTPSASTPSPAESSGDAFKDVVAQIEAAAAPAVVPNVEDVAVAEEAETVFAEEFASEPIAELVDEPVANYATDATDELAAAAETDEPSFDDPEPIAELVNAAPSSAPAEAPSAAKPATPRPMVAKTTPSDDAGDWMTWALVGGGAVVLLLGGVFVMRKRGSASDEDDEWDDDGDDAGQSFGNEETVVSPVDGNPFAENETPALGTPLGATIPPSAMGVDEATIVSVPDEEKESESVVFDDTEENVMDDMEVISRDQVNVSLGSPAMPAMGDASPDTQQMFAQMMRRMEALESRCDELVDARDRLERQVAAQTEELRVQRAAIARTQRAVRNLGRGEEGEENEATEPALRDPNQPASE